MRFWKVRMISSTGELASHPGWLVLVPITVPDNKQATAACNRVKSLGIDNGPDGEYASYPELTADIIEWSNFAQDVAEL